MKKCSTLCVRGIQNKITVKFFSSVHFSHSLVSDSLWPHLLHYARLSCPSATSRACSNSRLSSRWYISTISSSVVPFCSHLQSFPASGSFPMSQFFASGCQSIGASVSASVLPMNIQGLNSFRIDWFGLLAVQGPLKSLLQHHSSKGSILQRSAFFIVQLSHPYMNTGKSRTLLWLETFVGKVRSLLFNMLSRLGIAFLLRSLLITGLQSPSSVILEPPPPKNKVCHCFNCFPIYLPWSDGKGCHDLSFLNVEFKLTVSLSSFTFIKRLFSSSLLSSIRVVSPAYGRLSIFLPKILIPTCASSSMAFHMM